MKHCFLLLTHLVVLFIRLLTPNGFRAIVAENLALKQQLLIIKRSRHRAPNLKTSDRFILAWLSLLTTSKRIFKSAIIIKPATILHFHQALVRKKYSLLYSSKHKRRPGPKGPDPELIKAIVAIKQRNPQYGSPRIAMIISHIFGIDINKDIVRRILQSHYKPDPNPTSGPSWLSFIGNMKNSLWSVDLFKCESITLKSHWVMIVMDIWSRKIIGFAVHQSPVDGPAVCQLFNQSTAGKEKPRYLSSDNDPLFKFHRWQANLRIMEIEEIKTIPYCPLSHPYIERVIGTIRRECLDQTLFWNATDLERKLNAFKDYYNQYRVHASLDGVPPEKYGDTSKSNIASLHKFGWKSHCSGLFKTPIPA